MAIKLVVEDVPPIRVPLQAPPNGAGTAETLSIDPGARGEAGGFGRWLPIAIVLALVLGTILGYLLGRHRG